MACCTPSFNLPQFNLEVGIFTSNSYDDGPNISTVGCLRRYPSQNNMEQGGSNSQNDYRWMMEILLPALTDVRPPCLNAGLNTFIECPLGARRFYRVLAVDDIAKGYPNEHRFCLVIPVTVAENPAGEDFLWDMPMN